MAKKKSGDSQAWLATFADLMSLLMAVFVLLFAMSTLDANKYEALVKSLTQTLGHGADLTQQQVQYFTSVSAESRSENSGETVMDNLKPLYDSLIETYAPSKDSDITVTLDEEDKMIRVRLPESISFSPGRADLKASVVPQLRKLKSHISSDILVKAVGHTDKRAVSGGRFKSNWELSSARAAAVVQQLVADGVVQPSQVEVVGVADTQPLEVEDSLEAFAKNRRVEILLIPVSEHLLEEQAL